MEEWKDIINYEGIYQVSTLGKIKSFITNKIIKPSIDRFGYVRFSATKDKQQKTLRIHRVVMETFNPINIKMQINHKDGNKENNSLNNLEYCTDSENKIHAYKTGLMVGGNQYLIRERKAKRYTKP